LYKPQPVYTAEAKNLHIEGTINVKIHVAANGAVTVLGISSGSLGHGLDESARQCAQGIRFKPAVDASGNPVDWDGVVSITFQIA
jgi:TonB family protein